MPQIGWGLPGHERQTDRRRTVSHLARGLEGAVAPDGEGDDRVAVGVLGEQDLAGGIEREVTGPLAPGRLGPEEGWAAVTPEFVDGDRVVAAVRAVEKLPGGMNVDIGRGVLAVEPLGERARDRDRLEPAGVEVAFERRHGRIEFTDHVGIAAGRIESEVARSGAGVDVDVAAVGGFDAAGYGIEGVDEDAVGAEVGRVGVLAVRAREEGVGVRFGLAVGVRARPLVVDDCRRPAEPAVPVDREHRHRSAAVLGGQHASAGRIDAAVTRRPPAARRDRVQPREGSTLLDRIGDDPSVLALPVGDVQAGSVGTRGEKRRARAAVGRTRRLESPVLEAEAEDAVLAGVGRGRDERERRIDRHRRPFRGEPNHPVGSGDGRDSLSLAAFVTLYPLRFETRAMSSVPERSEVDPADKWDLESIYASDDDWEAAYEAVEDRIEDLESYEGRAVEDAETLLDALACHEEVMREVAMVASYARMRSDEDTTDQRYQALSARAQSLAAEAQSTGSYLEPEIQSLTREEFEAMCEVEPNLETYDHYVDDVLRMKPHTRSAEVEALLADLGEVTGATGDVYSMLSDADMTFPDVEDSDGEAVELTQSNFTTLLKRPDREFRRRVHETYFDEWGDVRNTVASAYKNSVKSDVKLARARNYDTARAAALDGPNVPVSVYDTLVETVNDNLGALHRHAELKRDALELDELRMWDLYMPLTGDEGPDLSYEEATDHVVEAVAPLGEEYQSRVAEGLDSRWVDVYENEGKRSGAYSGGTYDTQPFILMNYQDDVSSMYTLAHELGHSMHSELASESQPYVYSGYEIFVAEVASTVNEALLTNHLLSTVEDEAFRRHVVNEFLERVRSTLFRQTLFAEFEHETHRLEEEGEALTADRLDELYGDLKGRYYEPAAVDDRIAREWMRIPHFYRAFYVYQYSTGIVAALAIADGIEEDGEARAADYREFLRSGSREYPLELLRIAGVDMDSAEPIERAIGSYEDRIADLESLLDA